MVQDWRSPHHVVAQPGVTWLVVEDVGPAKGL